MTPKRIKELHAMCDAAAPGPWVYQQYGDYGAIVSHGAFTMVVSASHGGRLSFDQIDMAFIVAARTALPEALDALTRDSTALSLAVKEVVRLSRALGKAEAEIAKLKEELVAMDRLQRHWDETHCPDCGCNVLSDHDLDCARWGKDEAEIQHWKRG